VFTGWARRGPCLCGATWPGAPLRSAC
jgi:hypothetical protein